MPAPQIRTLVASQARNDALVESLHVERSSDVRERKRMVAVLIEGVTLTRRDTLITLGIRERLDETDRLRLAPKQRCAGCERTGPGR